MKIPLRQCAVRAYKSVAWVRAYKKPLTENHCRHVHNRGKRALTAAFSELQAWRGAHGPEASAKVKRERRQGQIIDAIAQLTGRGQILTMGKVAGLIGCTKPTLSLHYKDFFQGVLQ